MGDKKRVGVLEGGKRIKMKRWRVTFNSKRECAAVVGRFVRTNGRAGERKAVREWR